MGNATAPADRGQFLRIADVKRETGLSRSTIYRLEKADDFPPRRRLSANSMGWWSKDVDRWKADRLGQPGG